MGRARYLSAPLPGVVLESSGEDGFRWPELFSGVPDWTPVFPGPAVAGLSPRYPEDWAPA